MTREQIALDLLTEAMDSRAPDLADAAHPGWSERARAVLALHQQPAAAQPVTADQRQRVGQALCLVDREACVCAHDKRPFPGAWCASIVALANAALAALAAPADERRGQIAKIIFDAAVGVSNWDNEFWAEAREGCFETADKVLALTALDRPAEAHEIARVLCLVDGHDPDAEAPLTEMCDGDNMPVPRWRGYVEYAEALQEKFAISQIAEQRETKP